MPKDVERAPADRHAAWVALRTLRQRPTVVGRTDRGETVYEIGAAQALLAGGASHFTRLVQCVKCRRDVAGPPLLAPADLDRAPNPIFCESCVRDAVPTSPQPNAPPRPAPAPAPAPAVDPQVAALSKAVAELRASVAHAERELRAEIAALAKQREELERRLDQLTGSAEAADSRFHAFEQRVLTSLAPLMVETSAPRRPPGELLESLERQLREAEERIAGR